MNETKIDRIMRLIRQNGLTEAGFCRKCGINQGNWSRMRRNSLPISSPNMHKIATAMGVRLDWLESGEGEMYAPTATNVGVAYGDSSTAIVGNNNQVTTNKYGDSPSEDGGRGEWAPVIPASMARAPQFDIMGHLTKQMTAGSIEKLYSGTLDIDAWHYIDTDALAPEFLRGDCIGIKAYRDDDTVVPDNLYVVDTYSNGLIVRYLRHSEGGDGDFIAYTHNDAFQAFKIKREDIIRIYRKMIMFRY